MTPPPGIQDWLRRLLVSGGAQTKTPTLSDADDAPYELTDIDLLAVAEYIRRGARDYSPTDVRKLFTAFRGAENFGQFQTSIETSLGRWQPMLGSVPHDENSPLVRIEYGEGQYRISIEPPAYSKDALVVLGTLCEQMRPAAHMPSPCELWDVDDNHWLTITAKAPEQLVEFYNRLMGKMRAHTQSAMPLDKLTIALPAIARGASPAA